ncbi:hypothetical protein WJX77_000062 [Trebouxia sp. C0004]
MFSSLVRFTYPSNALQKQFRSGLHSSGRPYVHTWFSKIKAVQRVADISTSSYFSYDTVVTADVERDTIAALSSGSGRCGVALLRVSGPLADNVLQSLLPPGRALPFARQAVVSNIHHPSTKELLDRALLLRFPAPRSFTGEDIAELHVHGGPAVVRAVLHALCSIQGVRLAEPGEFTRRAFELGKVDLTEAEGLADLLSSETEAQRKQALKQSTGVQRQQYESWRRTLLQCLANVEAVIDFGEDEGIAEEVAEQVLPRVQHLAQKLQQHLVSDRRGELVRSGVRAAIVGPPNVGKSSVFNYLAGRKAAIVSAIPGTTRDAIEVILDIAGYKVIVTDTAGMRETLDPVEAEGVAVAHQTAQQADLVLSVLDWSNYLPTLSNPLPETTSCLQIPFTDRAHAITVFNKADALSHQQRQQLEEQLQSQFPKQLSEQLQVSGQVEASTQTLGGSSRPKTPPPGRQLSQSAPQPPGRQSSDLTATQASAVNDVPPLEGLQASVASWESLLTQTPQLSQAVLCSCKTGWNMDVVVQALKRGVQDIMESGQDSQEGLVITRARHRQHVQECTEALQRYEEVHLQLELAAEELRGAARALGQVTRVIDTEDLLDAIFKEFCIGK